ncbi:MAG: AraC family transcriptional regulator [Clostridia bacterium]|nr:AraC family transcriptional regulator [Clostridia bacterium]
MGYEGVRLQKLIEIDEIVTVHYFEYSKSYYFEGERHNFWEFLYVDKGEVSVRAEERETALRRGQMVFHKPGEFHALRANGVVAPNLVVVSFVSRSPAMDFFAERGLTAGDAERALLGRMVAEAESAFLTPLDDPLTKRMERRENAPAGAEQLLGAALEELLIRLLRSGASEKPVSASMVKENAQQLLLRRVRSYMEDRLGEQLTLEGICRDCLVSRSQLQRAFHARIGGGAMEYFGALKIESAKRMIREGGGNFTEIAGALGYGSIYYFSRSFKKVTGMTPSEYAASVKLLTAKSRIE